MRAASCTLWVASVRSLSRAVAATRQSTTDGGLIALNRPHRSATGVLDRRELGMAAAEGVEGGRTYDSLLLAAAIKSGAERIYTLNVRHFQTLADDRTRARIAAP